MTESKDSEIVVNRNLQSEDPPDLHSADMANRKNAAEAFASAAFFKSQKRPPLPVML